MECRFSSNQVLCVHVHGSLALLDLQEYAAYPMPVVYPRELKVSSTQTLTSRVWRGSPASQTLHAAVGVLASLFQAVLTTV